MSDSHDRLNFGPFELDPETLELWRDGTRVHLPPQPAKLLALLASRPSRLVSREDIRDHVWGAVSVDFEAGLHTCIRQIRLALRDDPNHPIYVETIPRRGYRFLATARPLLANAAGPSEVAPRRAGRWALATVLIVSTTVLAAGLWLHRASEVSGLPVSFDHKSSRPKIVVLPFVRLSPEEDSRLVADALAEEIRTDLARLDTDRLGVIARTSSEHYRNSASSVELIAAELGVSHLLEGSLRGTASGQVLSLRLIQVEDQSHLWADRFVLDRNATSDSILEVARKVSVELAPIIDPNIARPVNPPAALASSRARTALFEARYWFQNGDSERAEDRFRAALELEPEYAEAHAMLGELLQTSGRQSEAELHLVRAIAIDASLDRAHRILGHISLHRLHGRRAGRQYEEAVRLAPSNPLARVAYGNWLLTTGETDAAIDQFHLAVDVDPVSPLVRADLPWSYFFAGRFHEATIQASRSVELLPEFLPARSLSLWIAIVQGNFDQVLPLVETVLIDPGLSSEQFAEWKSLPAREIVQRYLQRELRIRRTLTPRVHSRLAPVYALLGETEASFRELEAGLEKREPELIYVAIDPRYASLRTDPRFENWVRRFRDLFLGEGAHR